VSVFSGHPVDQYFFALTAPANFRAGGDFDRLPIPFRAVTVDLKTGKLRVLKKGNLARAMRASMSVPVLFLPVEMDGEVLVDGGMIDNLPTDALEQWEPDVILGVDASSDLPIQTSTYNLLDVGKQVIKLWMVLSDRPVTVKPSLLIEPELGNHSPLLYGRIGWLIRRGYEAARVKLDSIRLLVGDSVLDGERGSRKTVTWRDLKTTRVGRVRVEGNQGVRPSLIMNRFGVRVGDSVDRYAIEKGTANLQATNLFREVWVDLKPLESGEAEIVLHAVERGHRNFRVFGHYQSDHGATFRFSLTDENVFKKAECLSLAFTWGKLFSMGEFFFQKNSMMGSPLFLEGSAALGVEKALYFDQGEEKGKFRFWRQGGEVSLGCEWGYQGWTSVHVF